MVLTYFTINDKIVQESLVALTQVSSPERKLESPVVVGGIAIQLHTQDLGILRPTSDVDLLFFPQMESYQAFAQGVGGQLQDVLRKHYQVQLKRSRGRPLFEVKVMNGQGNRAREQFFIHFDQVSPEKTERTLHISEREAQHAHELEYQNRILLVKKIEDIIPYKIKRARKTIKNPTIDVSPLERSLYDEAERGNWAVLAQAPVRTWMGHITQRQYECDSEGRKCADPKYILSKDLFDLSLLAQTIEGNPASFNVAYYLMAKKQLDDI